MSNPSGHPFFFTWTRQKDAKPVELIGGDGAVFRIREGGEEAEVLDLGSLIYQANLGHGRRDVIDAIRAQADRLCLAFPAAVFPEKDALARRLLARAGMEGGKVLFTLGGAEANENAVKIARLATGRYKVVTRYRSYHGATLGAATLSGDWRRAPVEPGIVGVVHVLDQDDGVVGTQIPRILELEEQVGAVLLESVVGHNGVLVPPPEYLGQVREACDRHGALLIVDEVLCGFGRTGRWFGFQHWDVQPDIVTCAKGIAGGYGTLGAVLVAPHVAERFDSEMLVAGLTYYAHPLAVAAGLAALDAYEKDDLIARAARLAPVLREALTGLRALHPGLAGDVRVIGLLGAIDLELGATDWGRLKQALWRHRVHCHPSPRVGALVVAPPLCIEEEQLGDGVDRIAAALEDVTRET